MGIESLAQPGEAMELAERAIERFIYTELVEAAPGIADSNTGIYMNCHLAPEGELSRRVLVVSDRQSPLVRVCIEAAYELFQGDVHHYVLRIGTVSRDESATGLAPLVREAYRQLMAWKPTHENIWDNVF